MLNLRTLWVFTNHKEKLYSFLVIDSTLESDNPLRQKESFRNNKKTNHDN